MPAVATHRSWYRNLVLVCGLALVALGLGNWVTGTLRLREHAAELATLESADRARGQTESADAAMSAEIEVARVRTDFYHVVASGGRLMTAAGIVLVAFGLARSLRGEARRSTRRHGRPTPP
jgi:hypothetical protein